MFGDNKSVVSSSTVPHSLLSKRHNILSYHRVREAIAVKIHVFHWCDSSQNKSDILSKQWEFSKVFHIIRDLFDFQGKITLIKLECKGLISQKGEQHNLHQNPGFQVIEILLPITPRILLEVTGQLKKSHTR